MIALPTTAYVLDMRSLRGQTWSPANNVAATIHEMISIQSMAHLRARRVRFGCHRSEGMESRPRVLIANRLRHVSMRDGSGTLGGILNDGNAPPVLDGQQPRRSVIELPRQDDADHVIAIFEPRRSK